MLCWRTTCHMAAANRRRGGMRRRREAGGRARSGEERVRMETTGWHMWILTVMKLHQCPDWWKCHFNDHCSKMRDTQLISRLEVEFFPCLCWILSGLYPKSKNKQVKRIGNCNLNSCFVPMWPYYSVYWSKCHPAVNLWQFLGKSRYWKWRDALSKLRNTKNISETILWIKPVCPLGIRGFKDWKKKSLYTSLYIYPYIQIYIQMYFFLFSINL